MAEIKIEKKKPIWPWILVILIILAAIYFFWYYNDQDYDRTDNVVKRDTISQVEETPYYNETNDTNTLYTGNYGNVRNEQAFADYFSFLDNRDNKQEDKTYYRTGFFKLITATKRQAEIQNVDVSSQISSAMDNAEKLTNDPTSTAKADNIKKAATEVSNALRKIQKDNFDNLDNEATDVEKAASNIEGSKTMDTQNTAMDSFFDKAARLLQKMYESDSNR